MSNRLWDVRVGDRVFVAGDWKGYGNSSYSARVLKVSYESGRALVRDEGGHDELVELERVIEQHIVPSKEADA
jgi:hypothetical protein